MIKSVIFSAVFFLQGRYRICIWCVPYFLRTKQTFPLDLFQADMLTEQSVKMPLCSVRCFVHISF